MKVDKPSSRQPIPPAAQRVFKGKIFDVWQWPQELFDGSQIVFEKIKRRDTAMVIAVTLDQKIIITDQEQPAKAPFLALVGGRVDEGEKPFEAAKRELLEETGHEPAELFLWDTFWPVSKIDWTVYTFIAKGCRQVTKPSLEAGEKVKPLFLNFDEFIKVAFSEDFQDVELTLRLVKLGIFPDKLPSKIKEFKSLLLG